MVAVAFSAQRAYATSPTGSEYNHALATSGGVASASGSSGTNLPANAIDGSSSTYWQSSTTTGWIAVQFRTFAYINVVHAHFTTTKYGSLSLYLDTSGNGAYETGEKAWSTTTNGALDTIISIATKYALGMKLTVDKAVGQNQPKINEFEAYLQGDSDGDGLTNDQEVASTYYQDMQPGGLPQAIPDDAVNVSSSSVSLAQFYGVRMGALANFTIDHPRRSDLTAKIGYWNGSAWVDRYVWDPGKRLLAVGLTRPDTWTYYAGTVNAVATVAYPDVTSKVEFRVDGVLKATVTTPVGNEYRWDWVTSGDTNPMVNVTQYDVANGRAWDQHSVKVNNVGPTVTWKSPANGATVSGPVTVKATATDLYIVDRVQFYLDNVYQQTVYAPIAGTQDYAWTWGSDGWMNGAHTIKAIAYDRGSPQRLTTSTVNVTTSNDPAVHITAPASGQVLAGLRTVTADATSVASSISKVEFYVDGALRSTDTSSPYSWAWDTTGDYDGSHTLMAKAYRLSDGRTALSTIPVTVYNNQQPPGDRCPPICPTGPVGADEPSSAPAATLGVLGSEWPLGETDVGTNSTVVVHLTGAQSGATPAENASRILRPAFPLTLFTTYLQWRLVIKDWSNGNAGNVTAFTLRFEVQTDPQLPFGTDTDGDGIRDGTEVNLWHTLPITRDSDLDGLTDDYEITAHTLTVSVGGSTSILAAFTTDPTVSDSDGDGLSDGQERGFVTTGQSKVIGEVGMIKNLGASWTPVFLRNRYTTAVVIAEPTTFRDSAFSHVRITAITDHTFQAKIEKWVTGGSGAAEDVAYLVVESGDHILPDGSVVEAGKATAVGTAGMTVTFREPFSLVPFFLVQTQTTGDSNPVIAKRTDSYTATTFGVYLNANASASHGTETVGYIAISPQATPNALATWTRTAVGVSGQTGTWTYPTNFSSAPLVLAWFRGEASGGNKNVGLRLSSVTNHSATVYREQAAAAPADTIEFFAFASPMNLTARMTTKPMAADTDADTLADGTEVNSYGSNPSLTDSDADGIADNVEVTSRTMTIPVNGTAKTITFKTSPTSDDTDADGVKDPDELNGILDHRLVLYDMSTLSDASHLRDLAGNGIAGTLSGPTNTTSTNKLKVGNALDFDGVNDKVSATVPGISSQAAWSFSLWFQWDNGVSTSYQHLLGFGPGHDATVYMNKATLTLALKVTDASGNSVADVGLQTFTSTTAKNPHQVAVTFDGTNLRAYVDGVAKGPWTAASARIRTDAFRIGTSGGEAGNYFDGRIDEVSVWDRALSAGEATGYYNLTNGGGLVTWLDMETRTSSDLFDFSGTSHPGVITGTSVVEGRSGFARKLSGGTDGISLSGSASVTITSVTVDLQVLLPAYPISDTALIARKGSFYLNISSDGIARWSLYKQGSTSSPLPIPLNRWVRITATASSTGLTLYLDGVSVASGTTTSFPAASNAITLGYTEGQAYLTGTMDQVLVLSLVASANTIRDLGVRGILLNPNGTDTDFDGLADGQELFVKSVKTPKRYPIPNQVWTFTDNVDIGLSAPAWAIRSVDLMTGLTHPDMGQLQTILDHYRNGLVERQLTLRSYQNVGEANNFTSYDLLNKGVVPSELTSGGVWYLQTWDQNADTKKGQMEYMQLQVGIHTWPNRADTDVDGLNDSEEVNPGSDGFQTDPWKADTDGDTLADNEYFLKGTSPVLADTDRDGVRDDRDFVPLGDAFVEVSIESAYVQGSDSHNAGSVPLPFVKVTIQGNTTYTSHLDGRSGSWYTIDPITLNSYLGHRLSVNVPDDVSSIDFTVEMWSYDSRAGYNQHTRIVAGSHTAYLGGQPYCEEDPIVTRGYSLQPAGQSTTYTLAACPGTPLGANSLTITLSTKVPDRVPTDLIVPSDFSGVYNVTNASGGIMGHRYTGEPRFVGILLNTTTYLPEGHCYCGPAVPMAFLIPRSIFFETELYKRLNASNPTSPLDKLTFRQNDTSASSNSDGLQEILSGNVTMFDWAIILGLLQSNATGTQVRTALRLTNDLFLYSLPDDAVRFVAYTPPLTGPSTSYTFCTGSCGPPTEKPWWEKLWDGLLIVTAAVVSAVLLPVTGFAALVRLFAQVGAWLWTNLIGPGIAIVAGAVRAAAKVVGQVLDFVYGLIRSLLDPVIRPLNLLISDWLGRSGQVAASTFHDSPSGGRSKELEVWAWLHVFFDGPIFQLMMGMVIALVAVEVALVVIELATPGGEALGAFVRGLLVSAAEAFVEHWVAASIATFAAGAILGYILPETNLAWGIPLSAVATTFGSFLVFFAQSAWARFTSGSWAWPGGGDIAGFILSFLGFLIAWRALDLVQFGLTIGESAIIGAVISFIGLGISWFSKSPIDQLAPEVGHIDEIANAGFFGFSLGRAAQANSQGAM